MVRTREGGHKLQLRAGDGSFDLSKHCADPVAFVDLSKSEGAAKADIRWYVVSVAH